MASSPEILPHQFGSVTLPVTFGTEQNFRTEYIKFEVADFESSYHAILGRPTLAKFMAVPHYVYLLLKMPCNTGVLSLRGDLLKSFECDKKTIDHASMVWGLYLCQRNTRCHQGTLTQQGLDAFQEAKRVAY